ncbi:hypothetical protein QL285_069096 [Trifolium repens]|nr:hypothetical protein QL285_069096 [Trifolium repens]
MPGVLKENGVSDNPPVTSSPLTQTVCVCVCVCVSICCKLSINSQYPWVRAIQIISYFESLLETPCLGLITESESVALGIGIPCNLGLLVYWSISPCSLSLACSTRNYIFSLHAILFKFLSIWIKINQLLHHFVSLRIKFKSARKASESMWFGTLSKASPKLVNLIVLDSLPPYTLKQRA